jgi:hypothetical protein
MHIGYWWESLKGGSCVDNIKTDLTEKGWGSMEWIDLALDRGPVVGSCEYDNEPSGSIKCWEVLQ